MRNIRFLIPVLLFSGVVGQAHAQLGVAVVANSDPGTVIANIQQIQGWISQASHMVMSLRYYAQAAEELQTGQWDDMLTAFDDSIYGLEQFNEGTKGYFDTQTTVLYDEDGNVVDSVENTPISNTIGTMKNTSTMLHSATQFYKSTVNSVKTMENILAAAQNGGASNVVKACSLTLQALGVVSTELSDLQGTIQTVAAAQAQNADIAEKEKEAEIANDNKTFQWGLFHGKTADYKEYSDAQWKSAIEGGVDTGDE